MDTRVNLVENIHNNLLLESMRAGETKKGNDNKNKQKGRR
jgi:hypothetical protein